MSRNVQLPTIGSGTSSDCVVICDSYEDFIETAAKAGNYAEYPRGWAADGMSHEQCLVKARSGDISLVAASDKIIDELESKVRFLSSSWQYVNAVAGGAVNIGAYCAGVPNCMRQRRRVPVNTAPLSVVVDLTVSASLDKQAIARRGSAMLALVRLLSAVRPTDLYLVTCMAGTYFGKTASTGTLIPFNTKPLDLAVAANAITTAGFARMLSYNVNESHARSSGGWPLDDVDEYRRKGKEYWQRFCGMAGDELLFVPPAFAGDKSLKNPLAWIQEKLAEYGGVPVEE